MGVNKHQLCVVAQLRQETSSLKSQVTEARAAGYHGNEDVLAKQRLEDEAHSLKVHVSTLEMEKASTKRELESCKEISQATTRSLQSAEGVIRQLQQDSAAQDARLQSLQDDVNRLQDERADLTASHQEAMRQAEELRNTCREAEEAWTHKTAVLEGRVTELRDELRVSEDRLTAARDECGKVTSRLEETATQLAGAQARLNVEKTSASAQTDVSSSTASSSGVQTDPRDDVSVGSQASPVTLTVAAQTWTSWKDGGSQTERVVTSSSTCQTYVASFLSQSAQTEKLQVTTGWTQTDCTLAEKSQDRRTSLQSEQNSIPEEPADTNNSRDCRPSLPSKESSRSETRTEANEFILNTEVVVTNTTTTQPSSPVTPTVTTTAQAVSDNPRTSQDDSSGRPRNAPFVTRVPRAGPDAARRLSAFPANQPAPRCPHPASRKQGGVPKTPRLVQSRPVSPKEDKSKTASEELSSASAAVAAFSKSLSPAGVTPLPSSGSTRANLPISGCPLETASSPASSVRQEGEKGADGGKDERRGWGRWEREKGDSACPYEAATSPPSLQQADKKRGTEDGTKERAGKEDEGGREIRREGGDNPGGKGAEREEEEEKEKGQKREEGETGKTERTGKKKTPACFHTRPPTEPTALRCAVDLILSPPPPSSAGIATQLYDDTDDTRLTSDSSKPLSPLTSSSSIDISPTEAAAAAAASTGAPASTTHVTGSQPPSFFPLFNSSFSTRTPTIALSLRGRIRSSLSQSFQSASRTASSRSVTSSLSSSSSASSSSTSSKTVSVARCDVSVTSFGTFDVSKPIVVSPDFSPSGMKCLDIQETTEKTQFSVSTKSLRLASVKTKSASKVTRTYPKLPVQERSSSGSERAETTDIVQTRKGILKGHEADRTKDNKDKTVTFAFLPCQAETPTDDPPAAGTPKQEALSSSYDSSDDQILFSDEDDDVPKGTTSEIGRQCTRIIRRLEGKRHATPSTYTRKRKLPEADG